MSNRNPYDSDMTATHHAAQPVPSFRDDDRKATILPPSSDVTRRTVVQRPLLLGDAYIPGHGIDVECCYPLRATGNVVRLCMRGDDLPVRLDAAAIAELRDYLTAALEVLS